MRGKQACVKKASRERVYFGGWCCIVFKDRDSGIPPPGSTSGLGTLSQ